MTFLVRAALGMAAGALALAAAPAVYAQQTTAAVTGATVDYQNKPVGGATVTILHVPTGTRVQTVTDASGVFSFRGLRVGGPYRIIASAKTYSDQTIDNVYLNLGDVSKVKLSLAPAGPAPELVVRATRSLTSSQVADVGSRKTVRAADIEAVVSIKRDIRDIGRRDPLANLDLINRGTGPSGGLYIAGSSPRRNRITIDGVRSQDDFGLNTGGLSTNRGPVSLEAVEQVAIQAVPFDVEEGDFTGGALNLILKSGGNQFHGTAFAFFRTPDLVGDQVPITGFVGNDIRNAPLTGFRTITNYIHERNYGGFISGPLIKDRLFFAVSYENFTSFDLTTAGPAGAGFGTLFNAIPGISTGANATQADIDAVLANWKAPTYPGAANLQPGQVDLARPINDEKYSAKLDWNITDNQRLTGTYRHAFSSVWKRTTSTTSISLDTNWYVQPETEDNYSLQLNSNWTPRLSTEARVSYRSYDRGQLPPEGQGFANISICTDPNAVGSLTSCSSGIPQIFFGPDQFRQANALSTTDWAGEFIANYRLGDSHRLKFGYQYKGIHVYDLFVQAAHGIYYFDSVADLKSGVANSLSYGGALSGNLNDAAENFSYQVHTLLGQDTWDVTQNLTANFGLRVDHYVDNDKPTLNTNFVNRYGFSNQTTYDGRTVWMPRFSARYINADFELSGGVGRVSGGIPDVFIGNSYGAQTGALTNSFTLQRQTNGSYKDTASGAVVPSAVGDALLGIPATGGMPAVPLQGSFNATPPPGAIVLLTAQSQSLRNTWTNSLAPNFAMPADWKANISAKTSRWGFDVGVDAVLVRSDTNVAFRDIRARRLTVNGVQQLTPDGRIRYDGLVLTALQRAAAGLPISSNPDLLNIGSFGDIQAYNPGKQNYAATVAFSVGRRWKGFDAFASYTWQDAKTYGGISEFGTTAGGNASTGNYYSDQTSYLDPNTSTYGKSGNQIRDSWKFDISYKMELVRGFASRFTLFAESHTGRPINFLMTDPANASGQRSPTFGVFRDDQLAYIPMLSSPGPVVGGRPSFSSGSTTVFFADQATLDKFTAVVNQFHLPQGGVVPKGFGTNPRVNRIDFQFAQNIPSPIRGHELIATIDIANLGNLLNKSWGVVKEYTNARAGGVVVNAQCADANGVAAGNASPVCASYLYSYTGSTNPATLATPTVDAIATQWSIEFGLKYKF